LKLFVVEELKPKEEYIDVIPLRSIIRHFMDSYVEVMPKLEDDEKDGIYYSIKEHIYNIGFINKYIDKYEVFIDKNNIEELIEGLESEIEKLYQQERKEKSNIEDFDEEEKIEYD